MLPLSLMAQTRTTRPLASLASLRIPGSPSSIMFTASCVWMQGALTAYSLGRFGILGQVKLGSERDSKRKGSKYPVSGWRRSC